MTDDKPHLGEPKEFGKTDCEHCGQEFTTEENDPEDYCPTCSVARQSVSRLSRGDPLEIRPDVGECYIARVVSKGDERITLRDVEGHETAPALKRTLYREELVDGFIRGDMERVQRCGCGRWYSYHSNPTACFACAVGLDQRAGGRR